MKFIKNVCLAISLLTTVQAYAGEPFKCHIEAVDKSIDQWIESKPMLGHGLEHFAQYSFKFGGRDIDFQAESYLSSTNVHLRVWTGEFYLSAWTELEIAVANASVTLKCMNRPK